MHVCVTFLHSNHVGSQPPVSVTLGSSIRVCRVRVVVFALSEVTDYVACLFMLYRIRSSADTETLTKPAGAGVDVVVTAGDQQQGS